MMDETQLLEVLDGAKRVLLVEPPYRRKYVPLGLAKIASYVKGRGGEVGYARHFIAGSWDLVCVTSLFTYDSVKVLEAIRSLRFYIPKVPIVIGGVFASLMPKRLPSHIDVFQGYSKTLDQCIPDYSLPWDVGDPWQDFSFTFTSRGCPNKCAYCAVWRLEPDRWVNPEWKRHIVDEKPFAMISDNNLSACSDQHIVDLVDCLVSKGKKVVFDNGVDCKYITPEMAVLFSRLKFTRAGMRLAFDRIEEDGVFQRAVRRLKRAGVPKSQIMAYVLFNFNDSLKEADYRMRECVRLGIRPYPQQYTPLFRDSRRKPYIGKKWTPRLVRTFRHFWLMAGLYTKGEFLDWVKGQTRGPLQLLKSDWDMIEADSVSSFLEKE